MISLFFFSSIILFFLVKLSKISEYSSISKIIILAFLVRIIALLIGAYFFDLPDSNQDARGFEMEAWLSAQENDFLHILNSYTGPNSFFYTWNITLLYSLIGRNILILKLIGVIFSISSVFLGWLVAKKIWNKEVAIKVSWVIALFPSLILYSVLTLREVYASFFLLVGILGLVNWIKFPSYKSLLLCLFGFIAAMHFHAPLIVGGIFSLIIFSFFYLKKNFKLILNFHIDIIAIFFIALVIIFFISIFSGKLQIQYLPSFDNFYNLNWLEKNTFSRLRGDASYGSWSIINSWSELIYKLPLRIAYFLFSPFVWMVSDVSHLFGALDGFIYLILIYFIFKNRRVILKDTALRAILLILVLYCIFYALGVSNFGSGIRHRSKLAIEIILLAGPLIPSLFWSRRSKRDKKL